MRATRSIETSRVFRLPIWLAAVLLLVSGCTSSLVNYEAQTHVVQPGETLYTIAWRYRLDYQQLA
ncbi:MAG: LysM peptidoglycan-binding domain-containing protein, partial [Gammaproteobacteria bacterium]